jgi:hypothetical protein
MKKKWKKPEVILLVRGEPEEFVTNYCKWPQTQGIGNGPDGTNNDGCIYGYNPCFATTNS